VDLLGENPFADDFRVDDCRHNAIFTSSTVHTHVYGQLKPMKALNQLQTLVVATLEPSHQLLLVFQEHPPLALRHRGKGPATIFSSSTIAISPRGLLSNHQH